MLFLRMKLFSTFVSVCLLIGVSLSVDGSDDLTKLCPLLDVDSADIPKVVAQASDVLTSIREDNCKACDFVANCSIVNLLLNPTDPIENYVQFVCQKAYSAETFTLNNIISMSPADLVKLFAPNAKMAVILHGYMDGYPGFYTYITIANWWMKRMSDRLSSNGMNVIVMDYRNYSVALTNYIMVTQRRAPQLAQYLFDTLNHLRKGNILSLSDTMLIGHSIGAHIAGLTGAAFQTNEIGTIGTIYGLGPAGICYTFPCDVGIDKRLDSTDASMVVCVHTNAGVFGTSKNCGCQDFYVNGGTNQPYTYVDVITNHQRAYELFIFTTDSIACSVNNQVLGIKAPTHQCGIYGLKTNGPPHQYCPWKLL